MAIPTTDRVQRISGVDSNRQGQRERSMMVTPAPPGTNLLMELTKIRALLERQMKPFTVQKIGMNFTRFASLPVIPAAGALLLDHDEDRDQIILVNPTAGQIGAFKWDDGNMASNNDQAGGILLPSVPVIFGPGGAPSNRLYGFSLSGNSCDCVVAVVRIDRFPTSTR